MNVKQKKQIKKLLDFAVELLDLGWDRPLQLTLDAARDLAGGVETVPDISMAPIAAAPKEIPRRLASVSVQMAEATDHARRRVGIQRPEPRKLPTPLTAPTNALSLATAEEVYDEVLQITRDAAEIVGKEHNYLNDFVRNKCALEHVALDEELLNRAIAEVRGSANGA